MIVDDHSTDQTTQVALRFSADHKDVIRVLRLGGNHGKGGAVKLGVQKARGEYILMVSFTISLSIIAALNLQLSLFYDVAINCIYVPGGCRWCNRYQRLGQALHSVEAYSTKQ